MKTEIDFLSDKEVEIWNYAESQNGTMDFLTEKLSAEGIFEQYRNIHKSYLELYSRIDEETIKLEILKRLIFLNWYALVEPSCYTGIEDLDNATASESYSILDQYLIDGKIDSEFKWMLSFYSSWDYTILPFSENKLEALTAFVKGVDTSILSCPKNQLPKGVMDNRGQMGIYWISMSVEKKII
ncbi:hypothetical protein [Pedobacter endophyticus]|uniref:Uncharacterized protein n=1 Tax=Pedobacter endophyticus TaxID=2789740 RepID=A0A7S9L067_9SPHI|nr:hypothetical protein [Pedobacter endophyticus]QPH40074.1 hypothetical protein IZT61_01960 [Pedobacter endophyticus]